MATESDSPPNSTNDNSQNPGTFFFRRLSQFWLISRIFEWAWTFYLIDAISSSVLWIIFWIWSSSTLLSFYHLSFCCAVTTNKFLIKKNSVSFGGRGGWGGGAATFGFRSSHVFSNLMLHIGLTLMHFFLNPKLNTYVARQTLYIRLSISIFLWLWGPSQLVLTSAIAPGTYYLLPVPTR